MINTSMLRSLLRSPHILDATNRSFLTEGSRYDCIDTYLDIMEDRLENETPPFVTQKDNAGAYDHLKVYTVAASLCRLCFPATCNRYFQRCMSNAARAVRTAAEFFSICENLLWRNPRLQNYASAIFCEH
eukprot:g5112.t1